MWKATKRIHSTIVFKKVTYIYYLHYSFCILRYFILQVHCISTLNVLLFIPKIFFQIATVTSHFENLGFTCKRVFMLVHVRPLPLEPLATTPFIKHHSEGGAGKLKFRLNQVNLTFFK